MFNSVKQCIKVKMCQSETLTRKGDLSNRSWPPGSPAQLVREVDALAHLAPDNREQQRPRQGAQGMAAAL